MAKSKTKKKGSVVGTIITLMCFGVLIASMVFAYNVSRNPDDAFIFGYRPLLVLTGSMHPTMPVNSIVLVKKMDDKMFSNLKVGDIVTFVASNKTITHRVNQITADGEIITKGDNNNSPDNFVLQRENIRAKEILIWKFPAKFIAEIGTSVGIIKYVVLPIIAIALIAVLIALLKVVKKERLQKKDNNSYWLDE